MSADNRLAFEEIFVLVRNVYEAMFIFDSNRFARDRETLPKKVEELIAEEGGEIVISRLWDERKLAYPIRGHRKGTYWLIYFRGLPGQIKSLNRQAEINDNILRHLVLKIHPHLEDAILAHAGEVEQAPTEDSPAAAPESKPSATSEAEAAEQPAEPANA